MLLFREKIGPEWFVKVANHIPEVLVNHAHLERKACSNSLNLLKYRELYEKAGELNSIAIEELQHFRIVLGLMQKRGVPFGPAKGSPWINGLMKGIRTGHRWQVIDQLICSSLIEGRSCEKFQLLSRGLQVMDKELADFYASLVESEGNHYAAFILMAREINDAETDTRLNFFLDLDAQLIRTPNPLPMLH